jgi:hypothetical protein
MYRYGSLDYNNYTKLEENLEKRINITSSVFNKIESHNLFQMTLRTTLLFS